ncbi:hypothetical protein EDEG_01132 [Edhazardia aedis USNM 41457]|uniref:Uncharacterized protein n=1 Tax=Edhazardia aedis (strain USNM 41457) TaxID=1003232 RepID=J8ZYD9_EDHAE|nr:hypothetical protein EDEG_01132 [Edhazardia aedis USNM 41457]|eukprot:EJW04663.1 hypothetical protein EDEG_01132 [Edhazardia aedis USNM 41457]
MFDFFKTQTMPLETNFAMYSIRWLFRLNISPPKEAVGTTTTSKSILLYSRGTLTECSGLSTTFNNAVALATQKMAIFSTFSSFLHCTSRYVYSVTIRICSSYNRTGVFQLVMYGVSPLQKDHTFGG